MSKCLYLSAVIGFLSITWCCRFAHGQVALDPSFGTAGVATFDFGGAYDDLQGLSVAPDGKIWAVGTGGTSNRFAVARLLPNGQFDNSFSGDGKLNVQPSGSSGSGGVHALPGGKVLLGVPRLVPTPRGFQAIRLNDNGSFDTTFGVASSGIGFIETPSQVYIEDLVVQPDDKILIGGYDIFTSDWNFVLTRFHANGTPDTSFGVGGRVVTDFSRTGITAPEDFLRTIAVQPDGKIVVGGHSNSESGSSGDYVNALARFLPDGMLDNTFGSGGKKVLPPGPGGTFILEEITDLHIQADGKILATSGVRGDTALVRLLSNGEFDTSFGVGGRILAPTNAPWSDPTSLLIDSQGRILLGGDDTFSVTRLLPNGSLDASFGVNGTFDINVGSSNFREQVTRLAWTPDGDLIVGGYETVSANVDSNWLVARLDIGPPNPVQTVTLAPTFDVKATVGAIRSITDGETNLTVGLGFNAENPEERPIFEFPLVDVPAGATVTAAILKLDPYVSSGSPRVEVLAYGGDGLASLSDITAAGTVLATTGPVDAGMSSIDINLSPNFIQSLLGESSHLGLRLRSLDLPLYVGFSSTEATFGTQPQLSITYTMPIEPGDFNEDGSVDGEDLLIWQAAYGSTDEGDADEDGDTDGRDLMIWQRNWTPAGGIQAFTSVPEPCSWLMLLLGGLALPYRDRSRSRYR
jgi:uncharacterized delta-60 repeat protein